MMMRPLIYMESLRLLSCTYGVSKILLRLYILSAFCISTEGSILERTAEGIIANLI